jgi:hypothetical protein
MGCLFTKKKLKTEHIKHVTAMSPPELIPIKAQKVLFGVVYNHNIKSVPIKIPKCAVTLGNTVTR